MRMKKAFTFAEMMIVFMVIGIIISLGVVSVRPWEKSFKFAYQRTYHSLALAIYNHMVYTKDDTAFPKKADDFCNALLEFMNTSDQPKDASGKAKCSGSTLGNNPTTFPQDKVRLKLSNGVWLWIGAKDNAGNPYELVVGNSSDPLDKVKFYIVYADLNGDRKPNTPIWNKNRMADIVAFIVTDKYAVIPIGYPEIDSRYLEAHVTYPSFDSNGEEETAETSGEDYITSDAMSYYEAKVNSFKMTSGKFEEVMGNISTYDFSSKFASDSPFKLKGEGVPGTSNIKTVYDSYYETHPEFDNDHCNYNDDTGEPVCSVKIHEYH